MASLLPCILLLARKHEEAAVAGGGGGRLPSTLHSVLLAALVCSEVTRASAQPQALLGFRRGAPRNPFKITKLDGEISR